MGRISLALLFVGLSIATPVAAAVQPDGRRLFHEYCSSCHGDSGKGDGPDALIFTAPPRNLHEGFLQQYSTEDLVNRVRKGRALQLGLDLTALRAHAGAVEDLVAHLKRLPGIDWPRVTPGWELYVDRCEICHGPSGQPAGAALPKGVRQPRDLSDPAYQRSIKDEDLITVVRHGRQHMPALTPRVSVDDARYLAQYVRLFSPGFTLYSRYCTNCHADDGRGVSPIGEEVRLPTVIFDRAYFAQRDADQLRTAVWHMLAEQKPAMPHFRALLTEPDARAIVEYLKKSDQ